jgi:hypothetical protein
LRKGYTLLFIAKRWFRRPGGNSTHFYLLKLAGIFIYINKTTLSSLITFAYQFDFNNWPDKPEGLFSWLGDVKSIHKTWASGPGGSGGRTRQNRERK